MKKKYNLALMPVSKSSEVIVLAEKLSKLTNGYLLGEKSFPHVTLYQFEAEEKEIDNIWKRVCQGLEKKEIGLVFTQFSCITFDNDVFWVSLLPDSGSILHEMYMLMASALQLPVNKSFDPHMTLLNTKCADYEKEVIKLSDTYTPIVDIFRLSLGISDEIGQFTEVVHSV